MTTWTRWLALPLAGLLLAAGGGHTQPPAARPADGSSGTSLPPPSGITVAPPAGAIPRQDLPAAPLPAGPSWIPPQGEPSIDQLLDRLEKLRQQKDELDRQERAVTDQIRDALRKQRERLGRLGVEEAPPPRAAAVPTASY